jgi:hypothetical protein
MPSQEMTTMRGSAAVVGLCLLLALAGCSSLPGFSEGAQAPGVEDGELEDAQALLDAHESALNESGYSHDLTINQTAAGENGTVENNRRQRTSVAAGASQYVRQVVYSGQGRIVAWGNRSVEYVRIEAGGSTRYQQGRPANATAMTGVNTLEPFLTAPFEVVDTEETDGRTRYTLESTGQPDHEGAFPSNTTSVRSFDARLVVDGDGRIHRMHVTAEYEVDGQAGSYEFTYELTSTEDPGVERPGWVDEIAQ